MTTLMLTPALALEYNISAPDDPLYAPATSVDEVIVVGDSSEWNNIDRSKNTAIVPPPFGSPESYQLGTGVTLNVPTYSGISGGYISSGSGSTYYPPDDYSEPSYSSSKFTLPDGLYYSDGSLGTLRIPSLDLKVKVYEDESLESLAKGAGHFKSTSCWDGNVGIAGHNRGVTNHFGQIHTLEAGDRITYTTQLGTRTYEVFFVGQISETDFSRLGRSNENLITLITCVRDVRDMRWCVQAREVT